MKEYDLIIIGGGVLGCFHVWHALNKGLKVALFERNPAPMDSSVRNFGQVVPSGMNTHWQHYGRRSLEIYQAIQSQSDIDMSQNGSIYIASDDEECQLIEELSEINQKNGYHSQLLTVEECLLKYPALKRNYVKRGLFFPDEISINPRTMLLKLLAMLQENPKFDYHPNTNITQLISESNPKIKDSADTIYVAKKILICSGTEFNTLFPQLFEAVPIELVKLQMLRLAPQKQTKIPGNILTGLSIRRYESFRECPSYKKIKSQEPEDSFYKKWSIHILFKQESDGSIILGDSHEYASIAQRNILDFDIRSDINDYFIEEGAKIFDLDCWDVQAQWLGYYAQCKDRDIFEHTIDENIHILTGIGGKGMTAAAGYTEAHLDKIWNA